MLISSLKLTWTVPITPLGVSTKLAWIAGVYAKPSRTRPVIDEHLRRKKARCTGERPKCSSCKRLMTACHYLHNDSRKRRPTVSSDMVLMLVFWSLCPGCSPCIPQVEPYMIAESLHKIGSQLDEIKKQLKGYHSPSFQCFWSHSKMRCTNHLACL